MSLRDMITFEYKGKQRTGQIISSTNLEPHYHWVYFNDEEITRTIQDDCIGFKKKGDQLTPTRIFTAHTELIETVKRVVENHIN
jgi:hypothetical protein